MKKFKGTKGEWHAVEYAGTYMIQDGECYDDNNILDCDVFPKEVVDASAQLMAAAPDLLKFAQFIAKHEKGCAPSCGYFQEMIEKAENVINKALGE